MRTIKSKMVKKFYFHLRCRRCGRRERFELDTERRSYARASDIPTHEWNGWTLGDTRPQGPGDTSDPYYKTELCPRCAHERRMDKVEDYFENLLREKLMSFHWDQVDAAFHEGIERDIFQNHMYEKFFPVEAGDIVLDIGASIGPFTYSILGKRPKHVYCVEPQSKFFETLIKNTYGSSVTVIRKGI